MSMVVSMNGGRFLPIKTPQTATTTGFQASDNPAATARQTFNPLSTRLPSILADLTRRSECLPQQTLAERRTRQQTRLH